MSHLVRRIHPALWVGVTVLIAALAVAVADGAQRANPSRADQTSGGPGQPPSGSYVGQAVSGPGRGRTTAPSSDGYFLICARMPFACSAYLPEASSLRYSSND